MSREGLISGLEYALERIKTGDDEQGRGYAAVFLRDYLWQEIRSLDEAREKVRRRREYLERGIDLTPDLAELMNIAAALQLRNIEALDRLMAAAHEIATADELACSAALREHARHSCGLFSGLLVELRELATSLPRTLEQLRRSDAATVADIDAGGPMSRASQEAEAKLRRHELVEAALAAFDRFAASPAHLAAHEANEGSELQGLFIANLLDGCAPDRFADWSDENRRAFVEAFVRCVPDDELDGISERVEAELEWIDDFERDPERQIRGYSLVPTVHEGGAP